MENLDFYWNNLEADSIRIKKGLVLRKLNQIGLHIGFNALDNQRLIVLESPSEIIMKEIKFPKWNGIHFEKTFLEDSRPAIVFKLKSYDYKDIFCAIANDLELTLRNTIDFGSAYIIFKSCLEKWEKFFEKFGLKILSREQQIGLFGELYFLSKYVIPSTDCLSALNFWRGHERKNQDFVFPNGNVEIKSTTQKQHIKFFISNEKQLDNTGIPNLFLYCLVLNEPVQKGLTLPSLILKIYEQLKQIVNTDSKFRDFLMAAGYIDEHRNHYEQPVYSINKEHFFKIDSNFPRIINLPEGIGDLKYSISISSCFQFAYDLKKGIDILSRITKNVKL